jgi:NHL repeat
MRRQAAVTGLTVVLLALAPATPSLAQSTGPAQGGLEVLAGTGSAGSGGDGGPAASATLRRPKGVAVGDDGTVYVSDTGNHTVRAVAPDGTISTVAGTGNAPATSTVPAGVTGRQLDLASPADLAVGPDHALYIADIGLFRVFKLASDGRISVLAGDGVRGFGGDGSAAVSAHLGQPVGLAVGGDGTVYIGDPDNSRVRAVKPDGTITTVAGNGSNKVDAAGGPATTVAVASPLSLAVDGDTLWIEDGTLLRRVSGGSLATVTVSGDTWGTADGASWPPAGTPVNDTYAITAHGGAVYVVGSKALLRFGADQRVSSAADLGGAVLQPAAAGPAAVYLADPAGNQVFFVRPGTAPAAGPDKSASSGTTWWPYAVGGAVIVLLVLVIAGVRRARR